MCGIAGILAGASAPPATLEELRSMMALQAHRGPDGQGIYRDERLALGHVRLSLIDLAGGFQPVRNDDGTVWLSFNGEIFNYIELRRQLIAAGHRFYTEGDSEVIVQAYERWGADAWAKLNGQFAFALWDTRSRQLWLVRDRLGILPLHYAVVGDRLLFASEAKALFAGGRLSPRFDAAGLAEAFTCWSASAPTTVFAGIRSVRPATALRFDAALRPTEVHYWQPHPGDVYGAMTMDEAVEALEEKLSQAVALRLRADVPVGCYVSGGLDSSVIADMARGRVGATMQTFAIRFADPRYDEGVEQRLAVRHLGTSHHEVMADGAAIRAALSDVVWHCETPLLRTSPVPLYLLSGLVQQTGIKTVMTGEGADEFLAGYTIFKEDEIRRFWARQPRSHVRPALLGRIHHYIGGADARANRLWQEFFAKGLEDTGHPFYSHLIRWQNTAWTIRLLDGAGRQGFDLAALMDRLAATMPPGWQDWDALTRAQWIEVATFLSPYLLACQGDRVAMAHGVEARYPFLDPEVVDLALALPRRHKMIGLRDKLALRRLAARRLPAALWKRRKQPYRAPIAKVLVGADGGEWIRQLLRDATGVIDPAAASRLLAKLARPDAPTAAEREEMGLVGVVSLGILAHQFGREFASRAGVARAMLDRAPLHVFEDRLGHLRPSAAVTQDQLRHAP